MVEAQRNANSTAKVNYNLRVPTSGAGWSNRAAGSLLTKPHILRTDDRATARHEHGAQRNANSTAKVNYNLFYFCAVQNARISERISAQRQERPGVLDGS